jgi:hypothetical protein
MESKGETGNDSVGAMGPTGVKSKVEKPWKTHRTKDGAIIRLPSNFRVTPSKYNPKMSNGPRNTPHCLNNGFKSEAIIKCRSCMWQLVCK